MQRLQQGSQFGAVASAYCMGTLKALLECQEALLPVVWRASVGVLDCLLLASRRPLFDTVDDEGEEEGHGKDGDKEVHDQSEIHHHARAQALDPGKQALAESWCILAGIQAAQILPRGRDIEEPWREFLLGPGWGSSRAPERPESCTWAGTGCIEKELAERSGHHGAGKGRAARQAGGLYGAGNVL